MPDAENTEEKKFVTFRVAKSRGYAGKIADQGYVGILTGIGSQGGLLRDFLEPDEMDWGDSELYRKHKGTWEAIYRVKTEGLYLIHPGRREDDYYRIVRYKKGRGIVWTGATEDRIRTMLDLIEKGASFEEARLVTTPPPVPADATKEASQ